MKDEKDNATLNAVFDQDTAQPSKIEASIGETSEFTPVNQPDKSSGRKKNVRGRILAGTAILAGITAVGATLPANNSGEQTAKVSPDPLHAEAKVQVANDTHKMRTDSDNPDKVIVKASTKPESGSTVITHQVKQENTTPAQPIEQYSSYGNVPPKQSESVSETHNPGNTGGTSFEAPKSDPGGASYDTVPQTGGTSGTAELQQSGGASYSEAPSASGGVQAK